MTASRPEVEGWRECWTLGTGEQVTVRPIRPDDAAIEQEFVRNLSSESKYNRFMAELAELTPQMLARFTRIDWPRDLALIVTIPDGGREREIAVARYVMLKDGASCEFAIVVADAWQGHGLGHRLMEVLMRFARDAGLKRMEGFVLSGNLKMLELMRALGFAIGPSEEGPMVKLVAREL
ncbi:MAG: GNAT family N-acetyltransferase [Betaproteobacteria bacterium]|nr:GNAT family N-acetyltransferase [Betaproteobacteria bacterium]